MLSRATTGTMHEVHVYRVTSKLADNDYQDVDASVKRFDYRNLKIEIKFVIEKINDQSFNNNEYHSNIDR